MRAIAAGEMQSNLLKAGSLEGNCSFPQSREKAQK
jgi:hypothetical protein